MTRPAPMRRPVVNTPGTRRTARAMGGFTVTPAFIEELKMTASILKTRICQIMDLEELFALEEARRKLVGTIM